MIHEYACSICRDGYRVVPFLHPQCSECAGSTRTFYVIIGSDEECEEIKRVLDAFHARNGFDGLAPGDAALLAKATQSDPGGIVGLALEMYVSVPWNSLADAWIEPMFDSGMIGGTENEL